jgi:hypothetical protein
LTVHQVFWHRSPILAHQVEQSAHLPLGLPRFAACLEGAECSTKTCVLTWARWIL